MRISCIKTELIIAINAKSTEYAINSNDKIIRFRLLEQKKAYIHNNIIVMAVMTGSKP